ncbi:MAG: hypothetical protein IPL87_01355 [Candidatus Moraniibacteriota bacterium]|nr:MAG: hypothetical protein IPL87_01355 [Candidatus Moranbacteria bacterium]
MNMPKGTSITFFERERIESFLRMKKKKTWIAEKPGRDYPSSSERYEEIRVRTFPMLPSELKRMRKDERKYQQKKTGKTAKRETEKVCRKRTPEGTFTGADSRPVENISSEKSFLVYGYLDKSESIYITFTGEGRSADGTNICDEKKRRRPKFSRKPRKETIPDRIPIHERPRSLPSVHTLETGKPIP